MFFKPQLSLKTYHQSPKSHATHAVCVCVCVCVLCALLDCFAVYPCTTTDAMPDDDCLAITNCTASRFDTIAEVRAPSNKGNPKLKKRLLFFLFLWCLTVHGSCSSGPR